MSQCKAEDRGYAPSVYYCRAEEGHSGPHQYRLAPACCAEARREALEEAAKVCDGIAASLDNEWNHKLGKADDMCGVLHDAAEDIRALAAKDKP